jgi:inorganic phosphate transporter, PiT family
VESGLLVVLAIGYAVVCGINDGGALVGVAIRGGRSRPVSAVLLLVAGVVLVPWLAGAPVARTLAVDLVGFDAEAGTAALAVAVVVALAVTTLSAMVGLPTSLTLATVGAFVGAGIGTALVVEPAVVVRVLVLAFAAPLAGAALAVGLMRLARLPWAVRRGATLARFRPWSRGVVAVAYGANDGQKMIAVAVVAAGAGAPAAGRPGLGVLVALGVAFGLGTLVGIRRVGVTLGAAVLAARPSHLVAGELASSTAVIASGTLGAPVSMTQSVAGAVAGAGAAEGPRRVRWRLASRLLAAWMITFPAALAGAALLGMLV